MKGYNAILEIAALRDYGRDPKEREALSLEQQRALLDFVEQSNVYQRYLPMLQIMIGLALRWERRLV